MPETGKGPIHENENVCVRRLHGCALDFMHLLVMGAAEIAKPITNIRRRCTRNFGHVVDFLCQK